VKLKRNLTIGREAACDLQLEHDTVSRRHASLGLDGDGRYRLEDLGSSNGTWRRSDAGWERVGSASLDDNDVLRFGEVELTLGSLLRRIPAVLISGELPPGDRLLMVTAPENSEIRDTGDPGLERPRRNPETGEIEESS